MMLVLFLAQNIASYQSKNEMEEYMVTLWRYRNLSVYLVLAGMVIFLPTLDNFKGLITGSLLAFAVVECISLRWEHLTIGQVIGSKETLKRRFGAPIVFGYIIGAAWFLRAIINPVGFLESFIAGLVFFLLLFITLSITGILLMRDE